MRQPRRVSRHLARQPFGTRRPARCPSLRTRQGPLPVPHDTSRHDLVPATPVSRQARGPSRALAALLAVMVRLRPRATANVAYGAMRCVDRVRCCFAARHLVSTLGAAITRRALRPGNVACGDRCVRGTLAPHHHAGTNDLLSKALGATGRKAAFAPRHYRIPPTGDMPRKATSAASDRRPVVTVRCVSRRPASTTTARIIVSVARITAMSGRAGSPPAGRSGRSRRPSAAPASRCPDRAPAPPRCACGPPARRGRRTRSRPPPRAAPPA